MSCLNLRLPPAKKAWQSFISKLQSKVLHKLYKSKAIKKPKYPSKPPSTKARTRRQLFHSFRGRRRRRGFLSQKKTAPVYIDRLFREPVADDLVLQRPPSVKTVKLVDKLQVLSAERSGEDGKGAERSCTAADDMWESLAFASPQLRGIDERAEEFISSFRAEMEVQEMMARGLYPANGSSL